MIFRRSYVGWKITRCVMYSGDTGLAPFWDGIGEFSPSLTSFYFCPSISSMVIVMLVNDIECLQCSCHCAKKFMFIIPYNTRIAITLWCEEDIILNSQKGNLVNGQAKIQALWHLALTPAPATYFPPPATFPLYPAHQNLVMAQLTS